MWSIADRTNVILKRMLMSGLKGATVTPLHSALYGYIHSGFKFKIPS